MKKNVNLIVRLLPYFLPIHPARMWIHTRQVYLSMGYLYCKRFKAELNPLILQLREELYITDYNSINWPLQRNNVSKKDLYAPHTFFHSIAFGIITELLINNRRLALVLRKFAEFLASFLRAKGCIGAYPS